jgi:hypothetical protein
MNQTQQLIKLRIETVQELKRLMKQMGMGSIDELLDSMIKLTDAHRLNLKNCGWGIYLKECWK